MNSANGGGGQVDALRVIETYKRLLSEANHQIAILQAQIEQLQEYHDGPGNGQR